MSWHQVSFCFVFFLADDLLQNNVVALGLFPFRAFFADIVTEIIKSRCRRRRNNAFCFYFSFSFATFFRLRNLLRKLRPDETSFRAERHAIYPRFMM